MYNLIMHFCFGLKFKDSSYEMKFLSSQVRNTKVGYGAVVAAGQEYQIVGLDLDFQPDANIDPPVTIEFSDVIYGGRFNQVDSLKLSINDKIGRYSIRHVKVRYGVLNKIIMKLLQLFIFIPILLNSIDYLGLVIEIIGSKPGNFFFFR